MSFVRRPSRRRLALTSSIHIWVANRAAFPVPARLPVSAMLVTILMGSAVRVAVPVKRAATGTMPIRPQIRSRRHETDVVIP